MGGAISISDCWHWERSFVQQRERKSEEVRPVSWKRVMWIHISSKSQITFLASQDALEVSRVTESLSHWVTEWTFSLTLLMFFLCITIYLFHWSHSVWSSFGPKIMEAWGGHTWAGKQMFGVWTSFIWAELGWTGGQSWILSQKAIIEQESSFVLSYWYKTAFIEETLWKQLS